VSRLRAGLPVDGEDNVRTDQGADATACTLILRFVEDSGPVATGVISGAQLENLLWTEMHTKGAPFAALLVNQNGAAHHAGPLFLLETKSAPCKRTDGCQKWQIGLASQ
jgi:hypothetical protein